MNQFCSMKARPCDTSKNFVISTILDSNLLPNVGYFFSLWTIRNSEIPAMVEHRYKIHLRVFGWLLKN